MTAYSITEEVDQGNPAGIANAWPVKLTNGINSASIGSSGQLSVEIGGSNVSAFGDIITVSTTPIMQFDFVGTPVSSSLMTQAGGSFATNGGSATNENGRCALSTGTSVSGSSVFISNKIARYRAGQGMTARFTAAFNTPSANNIQIVGMCAPLLTWTGAPGAPGAPIIGATDGDGYFFGYNGTSFGIRHKNSRGNGGAGLDTWIYQTDWNVDKCNGAGGITNPSGFSWNKQNGNVMMIRYPYLGYGNIKFFVQNSETGGWILCHIIKYTNSTPDVQVVQPSLNFFAETKNSGNTTDTKLCLGSIGIFLSGERTYLGPSYAWDGRLAATAANTELPVFSLRNCTSYNGEPNRGMIRLRSFSFSGDGANVDARLRIRRNPALTGGTFANAVFGTITGGSTGYILTSAQSITTVDTAATAVAATVAGANDVVFNASAARNTGYQIDLTPYDIFIVPGDTLTFTVTSYAINNNVQVAVNWNEDI